MKNPLAELKRLKGLLEENRKTHERLGIELESVERQIQKETRDKPPKKALRDMAAQLNALAETSEDLAAKIRKELGI